MAQRMVVRNRKKESFWRRHVRAQTTNGESVRAYCRGRGLKEPAFYWWRRELAQRDRKVPPTPTFLPVKVATTGAGDRAEQVTIELRGGRVLRLPMQMPAAHVTQWVRAVEAAS